MRHLSQAIVALFCTLFAHGVLAQEPRQFSYQAQVLGQDAKPIPDGQHVFKITLYTVPTGGAEVFSETQSVTCTAGVVSLIVGATGPLPSNVDFSTQYWLGIKIDGGAELTPRTAMVAVPYAMHAQYADSAAKAAGVGGVAGVSSINGMTGDITLVSGGSTTINKDVATKKITISSVGGSGTGIGGIQNADGTLTISNSTGPVATINMTAGSIDSSKLAPNAVSNTRILNGSITANKLAQGVIPTELPPTGPAGGDLNGFYPNPNVVKIQNYNVSANVPQNNQVLSWDAANNTWKPASFQITLPLVASDNSNSASINITNTNGAIALKGTGGTGVSGAGNSSGFGVYGISGSAGPNPSPNSGIGVFGTTDVATGVAGTSSAGDGVQGISSLSGGTGVHGIANNGSGAIGVLGESSSGVGVKASYTGSTSGSVAMTVDNGYIKATGNTKTAFVHAVAVANINGNSPWSTFLNYPGMAATDIVIVTHSLSGSALKKNIGGAVFDGIAYGVTWNGTNARWEIYLEDQQTNMPVGEKFNVLVIKQ